MSKIGKAPVTIIEKVKVTFDGKKLKVEGPKGVIEIEINELVDVKISETKIVVSLKSENDQKGPAMWGLTRALINNAVVGVSEGFSKDLELVGVGYRVEKIAGGLRFLVGYSHPVDVVAVEGITLDVEGNTNVKVSGIDRQVVGQVAAEIRQIRPPEPYKGKGIRYKDEIVKRKQGKVAKAASS